MQALTDKMLDENGNIKPEYAHLDPREIEVLQDWHKRQQLQLQAHDINQKAKLEGATEELKEETSDLAAEADASGKHALYNELENETLKQGVADEDAADYAAAMTTITLPIG